MGFNEFEVAHEGVDAGHRIAQHHQPAQEREGQREQQHFRRREKESKRRSQQVQVGCHAFDFGCVVHSSLRL